METVMHVVAEFRCLSPELGALLPPPWLGPFDVAALTVVAVEVVARIEGTACLLYARGSETVCKIPRVLIHFGGIGERAVRGAANRGRGPLWGGLSAGVRAGGRTCE